MESLTIQAYILGIWSGIAQITFLNSAQGNFVTTEIHYQNEYALAHFEKDDMHAVSINYPVNFFFDDMGRSDWLRFLVDIMPSGASRRFGIKQLDIEDLSIEQQNFILLMYGIISPVGNLRIKESLPMRTEKSDSLLFGISDVIDRASDFLDYAQERSVAAGGEAPKLLLRCSIDGKIWIDSFQDDITNQDLHYLVKFPRGALGGK